MQINGKPRQYLAKTEVLLSFKSLIAGKVFFKNMGDFYLKMMALG